MEITRFVIKLFIYSTNENNPRCLLYSKQFPIHSYFCGVKFDTEIASAGSQLHPSQSDSFSELLWLELSWFSVDALHPNQSNSEIRVTLTRNGVDSQLTPFRVKFNSAEIRVCQIIEDL